MYNSPYAFSENKVTAHVELEGLEAYFIHGTDSSPEDRWVKNRDDKGNATEYYDNVPELMKMTNNKTINADFNWLELAGFTNDEQSRAEAASNLVDHVLTSKTGTEEITLIGHSHGGNVAIQAATTLSELTGQKVNLIIIATPAYTGNGDLENPSGSAVNDHIHMYNTYDDVQTNLARRINPIDAANGKDPGRTYSNNFTKNVNMNRFIKNSDVLSPVRYRSGRVVRRSDPGGFESHSFDFNDPSTISNALKSGALGKLKPVKY